MMIKYLLFGVIYRVLFEVNILDFFFLSIMLKMCIKEFLCFLVRRKCLFLIKLKYFIGVLYFRVNCKEFFGI